MLRLGSPGMLLKLTGGRTPGDTTGTPEALVTTGAPRALVEMGVGEITGIVVVAPAMAGLSGGTDEGVGAKLIPAIPASNPVAADVFGVDVKETSVKPSGVVVRVTWGSEEEEEEAGAADPGASFMCCERSTGVSGKERVGILCR